MVKFHPNYMIFGQVMAIFKVNPDPDPHFRFLCEHGARGIFLREYCFLFHKNSFETSIFFKPHDMTICLNYLVTMLGFY